MALSVCRSTRNAPNTNPFKSRAFGMNATIQVYGAASAKKSSEPDMHPLFLTSQRLITQHWAAAARLLEPVLEVVRGEWTMDDLEEMCRDGRAVAGLAFDDAGEPFMAMVFEWRFYPRKTTVNIIALAGRDLDALASTFWPSWVEWCRESGATEVEACAHPAMTRLLRPLGFQHTYNFVRMPTGAAP